MSRELELHDTSILSLPKKYLTRTNLRRDAVLRNGTHSKSSSGISKAAEDTAHRRVSFGKLSVWQAYPRTGARTLALLHASPNSRFSYGYSLVPSRHCITTHFYIHLLLAMLDRIELAVLSADDRQASTQRTNLSDTAWEIYLD